MTFKLKTYGTELTFQREKEKTSGRASSHKKGLRQKVTRIFKDPVKQSRQEEEYICDGGRDPNLYSSSAVPGIQMSENIN